MSLCLFGQNWTHHFIVPLLWIIEATKIIFHFFPYLVANALFNKTTFKKWMIMEQNYYPTFYCNISHLQKCLLCKDRGRMNIANVCSFFNLPETETAVNTKTTAIIWIEFILQFCFVILNVDSALYRKGK